MSNTTPYTTAADSPCACPYRLFWALWFVGVVLSAWWLTEDTAQAYTRARTSLGVPLNWTQFPITYYIGKSGSKDVTDGSDITAIHRSFETWGAVDCAKLSFQFGGLLSAPTAEYTPGGPNQNQILWVEPPTEWPFPSSAVAVTTVSSTPSTGVIHDADIRLNGHSFAWSTTTPPPAQHQDIQNTITHELGHFLGLDHSARADATMYADTQPGETRKRDLHEDDRAGLCAIYPKDPTDKLSFLVVGSDEALIPCPPARPQMPDVPATHPTGCSVLAQRNSFLLSATLLLLWLFGLTNLRPRL